jgi:hypothetical protein
MRDYSQKSMARTQVAFGGLGHLEIWRVAVKMLNRQPQEVKGFASKLDGWASD